MLRGYTGTRTVLLTNFVPPYRVKLYQALRNRVAQLRILISTLMEPDRTWAPNWDDLDVVIQKSKMFKLWYHHPLGFHYRSYLHVPLDTLSLLRQYDPDVVISGEFGPRTLLAALHCRLVRPRCRLFIWAMLSEHTELGRSLIRRLLRNFLLSNADGVFVNGKSGFRYIRSFGFPEERIAILNQPVDLSLFTKLTTERAAGDAYRLIYVGQMIARKGLDLFQSALIDYAVSHSDRRIEMLWVGDGDLREKLQSVRGPENLDQHFLGSVPYNEVPALYLKAGIMVLPTLMDEWGLVVNEAMAAGLPVLGSIYSQAVEEMVKEGETGWKFVVRPDDMREAIERALSTPLDRLSEMRRNARARAAAITFDEIAERIAEAIRRQ